MCSRTDHLDNELLAALEGSWSDRDVREVVRPMSREEAIATEGAGWAGDLAEVRSREEIPRRAD